MSGRIQNLTRSALAITLAIFSTGCTVPPNAANQAGQLPPLPTGLLGQTGAADPAASFPSPVTAPDPSGSAQITPADQALGLFAQGGGQGGAPLGDTFEAPTRPGHDDLTALRNRLESVRRQLAAAQDERAAIRADSVCEVRPGYEACLESNQRLQAQRNAADAEITALQGELQNLQLQLNDAQMRQAAGV